jgi:hypothetical protein
MSDSVEADKPAKIFAVITVARQINGEYVFVKSEKAFARASEADQLLKTLRSQYVTPSGEPKPVNLSTPNGDAACFCEVGAFELDLHGLEYLKENNG